MRLQSHLPLSSVSLLLLSSALAQEDSSNELINCFELECPTHKDSVTNNCTVGDTSFRAIGVAPDAFSVPLSGDDDDTSFSWTVGSTELRKEKEKRIVEQHFFVGTPPDLDLSQSASDLGAEICALFISQSDDNTLGWNREWENQMNGSAECNVYMGEDCTRDLIQTATKQAKTDGPVNCTAIAEEIKSSLPDICPNIGVKKADDIKVTGVPLTGEEADLTPITGADNSSSNCYPTMPRSNVLTHVRDVSVSMPLELDGGSSIMQRASHGFTPILTVAVSENNNGEEVQASAFMSCVRPMETSKEGIDNMEPGEGDDGEDAGVNLRPNWTSLSVLLAVAGAVALQL